MNADHGEAQVRCCRRPCRRPWRRQRPGCRTGGGGQRRPNHATFIALLDAHLKGTADRVREVVGAEPDVATLDTAA